MEKGNKTPRVKNPDPFTKSFMTPRSPTEHEEDNLSSDTENNRDDEEENSILIETNLVCNALTNSRIIINSVKTTLSESKGKISMGQKEKINEGMDNLFDIIAHLVSENNEMKGEIKILRPLTKIVTQNFIEVKKIMQENKSLFNNMNTKNEEIKKDIRKIIVPETYAEKVKKHEPIVIIKPKKKNQENIETKNEIKGNIDPVNFGITGMRNFKDGGVIVEFKNATDIKKIHDEVTGLLGDKYDVKIPQEKKPSVKIIGVTENYSFEELERKIKCQNEVIFEQNSKIKVTFIKETKNPRNQTSYTIYADVDGKTYHRMLKEEKINIGWDRCRVYDNLNIMRCFKCNGFNHKAIDCRNLKSCPKCAKHHDVKDCTDEDIQCINCIMTSKRLGLKLNSGHSAMSKECPIYKRKLDAKMSRISFL